MDFRAGKALRLRGRTEIRRVFEQGRRLADARLTLWGIPSEATRGASREEAQTPRDAGESLAPRAGGMPVPPPIAKSVASGPRPARCGVAVSKAHGKAVRRNRVKRLCREAFRLIRHELPAGWDFMVVPRAGADLRLPAIQESLRKLAFRLAGGAGKGGGR